MIKIICVGKIKEKYLRDAISDYEKRISKYHKINIIEVEDSNMKEESIRILKKVVAYFISSFMNFSKETIL